MTQKVKEMAPKIWEAIQKSSSILLHFHPSPDPDTVGSSLAMYQALESLGKKVTLIKGDSEIPLWVTKLPYSDRVTPKSYLEINPAEYDLFIIMDSSAPDMISTRGEVVFPEGMVKVVIDHHISNKEYGDINLVDAEYIATAEMITDLLKEWGIEITPTMASVLMLGIYSDSGGFKYPRTNQRTFLTAAELAKINPDYTQAIFELENNDMPGRIKYLGLALESIENYFGGKVAISAVSYESLKDHNLVERDTEKSQVANILKSVVGWDIGITFTEREPGNIGLSFRTRDADKYDVSKIASELGGGGHRAAGGATIKKPFEEAKKYLLKKLAQIYPSLGTE